MSNNVENAGPDAPTAADLRRKAEEQVREQSKSAEGMTGADVRALLHELQVHQIELEMQNEELLCARAAAQEVSDKYQDLFDFAPTGYFLLCEQGRILEVNLAGAALLGLERIAVVNTHFGQYVTPETRARFAEFCENVLRDNGKQTCEIVLQSGEQRLDIVAEGIRIQDSGEGKRLFRVTVIDVTERKRMEDALRESEERFRAMAETVPDMLFTSRPNGRNDYVSSRFYEYTGLPAASAEEDGWTRALHPDDLPATRSRWANAVSTGEPYQVESRLRAADGSYRWFLARSRPIRDANGRIVKWFGACSDIDDMKRAEHAMRQNHDELQAIYSGLLDGLLIADVETRRFVKANPAMCRLLGYSEEEFLSLSVEDIHPPDVLPEVLASFQAQAEGRLRVAENCPVLCKDGAVSYADIGSSRIVFGDRPCVVGFFHDVTERRRTEEAIQDRDEELVAIYENAPVIMLMVDAERRVRKANKFARQFAGASEAELVGRRGGEALRCAHAPDDPRGCGFGERCQHCPVRHTVLDTLADGRSRHQVEASRAFAIDGKSQDITFLLSTARLHLRGQPQVLVTIQDITDRKQMEKALARLASFPTLNPFPVVEVDLAGQVHFLNPTAERLCPDLQRWGRAHPWLADWDSVVRAFHEDSEQEIVREVTMGDACYQQMMHYVDDIERVRIYLLDITARKRADEALQRTSAELARSNNDLQQFASVAAHDLQEPLRAVSGFVQLLQQKHGNRLDAEANQFIGYAVDGAKRMETLIRDLLAYSRVGSGGREPTPTDTGAVLREALSNLRVSIEETGAEITNGELPTVRADAGQLAQLFQNLISNALKFRGEAPPKIHVDASREEDHWLFSVRDNGIGIDPKHQDRIFEIFQRLHTRAQYAGTGIGLAVCKRIVDRHGGQIWVESEPGQGATFNFTLPT